MAKPPFLASEVKLNFKLRDFFLDLMACIVPGLIFLVTVSIIVGGLFFITSNEMVAEFTKILNRELKKDTPTGFYILDSYSFNFWLFLLVTFLSYFAGHLLYRQTPKRPDYASFIRIRDRVIKKGGDPWVIAEGRGVISTELQFPYDNLNNYLDKRGFDYLADYVDWNKPLKATPGADQGGVGKSAASTGSRSKTIINRAKIRLNFFFPEHMINLIRNEAHIRLASSMWYGAKFTIELSYICLFLILLDLNISHFRENGFSLKICGISLVLLALLLIGKRAKFTAVRIMRGLTEKIPEKGSWAFIEKFLIAVAKLICRLWGEELNVPDLGTQSGDEEEIARSAAKRIDYRWKVHDHMALVLFGCLFLVHFYEIFDPAPQPRIIIYLGGVCFILIGVLFAKRYVEQTIHYQRVRELVYVLETAHVAHVIQKIDLPNPLEAEEKPEE